MGTYFEDSEERQRKLMNTPSLKLSNADALAMFPNSDDPYAKDAEEWDTIVQDTETRARQERDYAFAQKLAGYEQIENDANMAREAYRQDQGTALIAVMNSIRKRGGTMDPALNQSISQAFGMNITGAFLIDKGPMAGTVVFGTPQKMADGSVTNGMGMMLSPEQRYRIFDRMKAGDITKPYMEADYAAIKQSSGLTEDQLANAGIVNPNTLVVGGTSFGGAKAVPVSKRLRPSVNVFNPDGSEINKPGGWESTSDEMAMPGPRPRQSRISVFASDGKGGTMTREYDGRTGEDTGFQYGGNWDPNASGQWKQMSVGPSSTFNGKDDQTQVRVYENSKTGERVTVKDGETPPWQRGSISDRLKIAEMNEHGRNARQDKRLSSKEQIAAMNKSAPKYDPKLYEDLKKDLEGMEYETSDDGSPDYTRPKTLNDDQKAEIEARKQYLRDIRWGAIGYGQQNGGNPPPDGNPPSEENPPATQKVIKVGEKVATAESVRREIERRRNGSSNGNRPFKNISEETYAQLSEEDKKKCKQVAKGRGYVMYLDNSTGSTGGTQDNKPYPETLKGVDDDWDFSNEERDDFNRLAKKYPNELIKGEESTNEAYRELYERLKKKEAESQRRKENAQKASSSKKKKVTYKPGKFPY